LSPKSMNVAFQSIKTIGGKRQPHSSESGRRTHYDSLEHRVAGPAHSFETTVAKPSFMLKTETIALAGSGMIIM
jgi:hypothetical protein